jgi:histidinol-phosphatase (PHP family)
MSFSKYRVFQRILPRWDFDLHVHTNWSQDNLKGPSMSDFIPLAERYKIHIGFADHYEMLYYESKSMKHGKWRLTDETVDKYLEELDTLKNRYNFVSSGIEIDYYPSRKEKIQEFVDDYRSQFDLIIGSLHEVVDYRPVTLKEDLEWLINSFGSFQAVVDRYFEMMFEIVDTQIFDVIAHPDVVFRFLTPKDPNFQQEYLNDPRVLELGLLCKKYKTMMEVNLSGYYYKWNQSFPNENYLHHLLAEGVKFIVGSDSHSLDQFEKMVLKTRKYNNILRERTN